MELATLAGPDLKLSAQAAGFDISGLTADSREVKPGYLFAALPGVQFDGAKFIPQAIARGAAAVLMSNTHNIEAGWDVPILQVDNPRSMLAVMAARFYQRQPATIVAVTGTNGKTSVAAFVRQIWAGLGLKSASLGTLGLVTSKHTLTLQHTTPEPVSLHSMLAQVAEQGIEHLAFEASSHGLAQNRVDGLRIQAAAFTNLSRDHLDYHRDFEEYLGEKLKLFSDILSPEGCAVVNADSVEGARVIDIAHQRRLRLMTFGVGGKDLQLTACKREGYAQRIVVRAGGQEYALNFPLVGEFQVSNALCAAALVMATGYEAKEVLPLLQTLKGARGRLDLVGHHKSGAPIFVDYSHTPGALKVALATLRPYVKSRLVVVFGAGGDRDMGKRPQMGKIAIDNADVAIITDDNPRTEDPAQIRREIMSAAPGAIEIGDRRSAIASGVEQLREGDILLVAGKGHETGQTVGEEVLPFSDHDVVKECLIEDNLL
jgi:UDP-N-acetylmuramoyl-L-alanyl-D-glutamate--2,6-diaminopimelate ligase